MSKIHNLIDSSQTGLELEAKIKSDLRTVKDAEKEGKKRPSFTTLLQFFQEEYGATISLTTVKVWYRSV
jgi:hypothetical protein